MIELKDRTALVTGGARGIGRAIALALAKAGCNVMIGDLGASDSAPTDWAYELASSDDVAATVASADSIQATNLNVTDASSCADSVRTTLDAFGSLDILINNAGIVASGPLATFSEADWERVFAVNCKGIFLMTQAAQSALTAAATEHGHAAVINTASIAGKQGYANMSAYCGSKFAAIGITQSMAAELAPAHITVNAICPGMVGTAMWLDHLLPTNATERDAKNDEFEAIMQKQIPMGRPQSAEDMGEAAVYLASAANVTGIALNVAGGVQMG
ncbi:MAG: SDR family NAD(P)-dependent oxidoreductase [Pseudomonadaceae bacterium]|nr:SDR family NAD(P)-dependent oxidoreductase [Pseudomonadaceae bacterium]